MRLHRFLPSLGVLFAALAACNGDAPKPAVPPNVILVVVDTLRADFADPAANRATLPYLTAFAKDGIAFHNAFSHAPMTLPSHTALFSARPPSTSGVTNNGQAVAADLPLLPAWLAEHGYVSQSAVSLATLWPLSRNRGLDRGFERFDRGKGSISNATDTNLDLGSILDGLSTRAPFFVFAHYAEPHEPYEAHGSVQHTAQLGWNGTTLETLTTSEWTLRSKELRLSPGVNRLEIDSEFDFKVRSLGFESQGKRLAVEFEEGKLLEARRRFVARVVNTSHQPVLARMDLWLHDVPALEELPARYRGEAEAADAAFGRLVAMLKQRGLYESSLIVFTSDHGEALGEHGVVGHVVNLHDEMLRVPLIIKLPKGHAAKRWLAGSQRDLVRLIDVVPTILDALALPALPGQEGSSLLERQDRLLVSQTLPPEAPRALFALRDLRTKLIFDPAADRFSMYDMVRDPGETRDIFEKAGAQRADWQQVLRELAARAAASPAERGSAGDPDVNDRLKALGY